MIGPYLSSSPANLKPMMTNTGKARRIKVWIQESKKLRAIGQWLEDQWQRESGHPSPTGTGPPTAMLIDFCIREVHKRISDPDVFMGRWTFVAKHLNEVLQAGVQSNMTNTLEGMGHEVKWTHGNDGSLIAHVGPAKEGGPSHRINVPARFYEAGSISRKDMGVRGEDLSVN